MDSIFDDTFDETFQNQIDSIMSCIINSQKNIAISNCNEFPTLLSGMFETPDNFVIPLATAQSATLLKAFLQAAMLAPIGSRIYWWPDFDTFADESEATTYQTGPLGTRETNPGRYQFKFGITQNLCVHKAMFTHKKRKGGALLLDFDGQMLASFNTAGDVKALSVALLNPEKLKFSDGSVATESPVLLALRRHKEIDLTGAMIDVSGFLDELVRLADVTVTITNATTTVLTVSVKLTCDSTPVIGLITTDFVAKITAGTAQVQTSFADNGDGTYTLTKSTNWATGTLTLKPPATLSLTGYEANTAAIA